MTGGDYPGAVTAQKPQRKNLKNGDILSIHLKTDDYLFARVLDDYPLASGVAVLIDVYDVILGSDDPEPARPLLVPKNRLLPPTYAIWALCKEGFARTVANWPLTTEDFARPLKFISTSADRGPESAEYVPGERSFRLVDRGIDSRFIVDEQDNPVSAPRPPYGRGGMRIANDGRVAEWITQTLEAGGPVHRLE
ncbi:hypothetical protein GCM10009624_29460 [Gordonia sinesedis]